MAKFNPDIMIALSSQVGGCESLKALSDKYSLTLYSVLTPSIISSIDAEINVNPFIFSEALSLLEMAGQLSDLYSIDTDESFLRTIEGRLVSMRSDWSTYLKTHGEVTVLQKALIGDYFVDKATDLKYFLAQNPVYLGIYLYVYTCALVNA